MPRERIALQSEVIRVHDALTFWPHAAPRAAQPAQTLDGEQRPRASEGENTRKGSENEAFLRT